MPRRVSKRLFLLLGGCAVLGAACALLDAALVARAYGFEYLRRLVLWRRPAPGDWQRFPTRAVAASTAPRRFEAVPDGPDMVRAAFRQAAPDAGTLDGYMERTGSTSFLVLRDGRLLYENYYNGRGQDSVVESFSVAKAVTSLLLGAAIQDGLVPPSAETPAEQLWPDVPGLRNSGIRLHHVLQMTSGFGVERYLWLGPFGVPWKTGALTDLGTDLRRVVRQVRPVVPPGHRFLYDDRNPMLVGMLLERATGMPVAEYLGRSLWQKLGAEYPASWSLDRAGGFEKMETGVNARARDFLKLGELLLRDGVAPDGTRILPPGWAAASLSVPQPQAFFQENGVDTHPADYGYFFWLFPRGDGPNDAEAGGIFGQHIFVSRRRNMVVVRTGVREMPDGAGLLQRLVDALP